MAESKITTKGQCVVPKKIRDYMRLNPGDKIDFVIREDGMVYVRPVILDIRELKGRLKKPAQKPDAANLTFDSGLKNNPVFRVL